ncbi:hypothetical protein EON63_00780 [archaeon]|nr:MAG: hypothetical protein EON63_00780 [archaeon]
MALSTVIPIIIYDLRLSLLSHLLQSFSPTTVHPLPLQDLNCGCPIDAVCSKGCGSSLLTKPSKLCDLLKTMAHNLPSRSVTVKVWVLVWIWVDYDCYMNMFVCV